MALGSGVLTATEYGCSASAASLMYVPPFKGSLVHHSAESIKVPELTKTRGCGTVPRKTHEPGPDRRIIRLEYARTGTEDGEVKQEGRHSV